MNGTTMYEPVHKQRVEAQAYHNHRNSNTDTSAAIEQINTTLDNLCDHIIPTQPYLISVPTDDPLRHYSRSINTWDVGTPFSTEEEPLQYLSFFSHQGEESLLKVVGGWADERGNWIEDGPPSPASASGRNTPVEQPIRKKISLKDYKTKDKTRPNTPLVKHTAPELRKEVMKSEAKNNVGKVEEKDLGVKTARINGVKPESRDSLKSVKHQLDGGRSPRSVEASRRDDSPVPRKKRRLSSESPRRNSSSRADQRRDTEASKGLPSLLSPTLPSQQRDKNTGALPKLLIPNLPPALEKLIAKADAKLKSEASQTPRTESVRSILGGALGSTADKRPPGKQLLDPNATRSRSDSQASEKVAAGTPKVLSPAVKPSLKTVPRPITPLQNGVTASPKLRQRHVVALKYGKKNRKRVEALLKFASRPKKVKPTAEHATSKTEEARPTLAKPSDDMERADKVEKVNRIEKQDKTETSDRPEKLERPDRPERSEKPDRLERPDKKRPAEPSPERPAKKARPLETPEKPKPDNISNVKSPAVTTPTIKSKADLMTPKKELKPAVAMRRIESQDGTDARTPLGDRGRTSTPVNAGTSTQAKVSPGPSNLVSKEDRAAWQEVNTKCFNLGRTLKHEGTSLGPSPGNERTEKDQALSAVLLIEALLCFMINHAAQSQARPSVDPGWSTILPYHIFVFRASRKYRHLHGLVIQLGAICRQAIHSHDIERLAREPLPFDNWDSAPTPGSDGNTRQSEDVEKLKKKYTSFRDQLVRNARELQSAWLEGSRYLSAVLIEREYPRTWAKRTKDTSKRGVAKLKPDAIGKEYYLPLDTNSTVFESARFALSFMKEWSDKEKIEWRPRIEF